MHHGHPVWWHHHGIKMKLTEFDEKERRLVIEGSAATVTIRHGYQLMTGGDGWIVDWEVIQNVDYDEVVRGRRHFSRDELAAAFGLTEESGDYGQILITEYGGDSAEQGKYIRWKDHLNIPCPGIGHDGDPNVSIHIDSTMIFAMQRLIG